MAGTEDVVVEQQQQTKESNTHKVADDESLKERDKEGRRKTEPLDAAEHLQKFLDDGVAPRFKYAGSPAELEQYVSKPSNEVKTDLLDIAVQILDKVKDSWGADGEFGQKCLGEALSQEEAENYLEKYILDNKIQGKIKIKWTSKLNIAGKFQETGTKEEPDKRRIVLWINRANAGVPTGPAWSRSRTTRSAPTRCGPSTTGGSPGPPTGRGMAYTSLVPAFQLPAKRVWRACTRVLLEKKGCGCWRRRRCCTTRPARGASCPSAPSGRPSPPTSAAPPSATGSVSV